MNSQKYYTGLSLKEVDESRKKYGANTLTPPKRTPWYKLYFEKYEDPIIRILLVAAFLSFGIAFIENEFAETIGIFSAILLATSISFWFEYDASKKFDLLNQVTEDILVKVIRNGHISEIPKKEIVVHDLVIISSGEEIPADCEILESYSLQLDESCLTGEPSVNKSANPSTLNSESTYPSNWAMRGSRVLEGHGTLRVIAVGDHSEYGKLAIQSTELSGTITPLSLQLEELAKFIGVIGFALGILTFITLFAKDLFFNRSENQLTIIQLGSICIIVVSGLLVLTKVWLPIYYDALMLFRPNKKVRNNLKSKSWGYWLTIGLATFMALLLIGKLVGIDSFNSSTWINFKDAGRVLHYFMVAVTLIVVAVPEGLPMSVTLSLALSMRRMLKSNTLIRKMHACETIGAITVICTDKTGTLTQNKMKVSKSVFLGLENQEFNHDELSLLIQENIATNSTAHLDFSNPKKIKPVGNPTEASLLQWLYSMGINYLNIRNQSMVIEQLTFSTERKFMATLVDSALLRKKIMFVKGAPEVILSKCKQVRYTDKTVALSGVQESIDKVLLQFQELGMRTIGFAYEPIEDNIARIKNGELTQPNLTFLGFIAISDPIRDDVPSAVLQCLKAGIEVKIVTGDTLATTKEIARQIGVWNDSDLGHNIITGAEFALLSDEEARIRIQHLKVMCRARPSDKQRFVQLLQQNGAIVAVTGDGTNDAPALNFAQVGLSMGSGTAVAKEASDITLLDDSFSSIAVAIMWGRSLYQNIQRFILFQLTINLTALTLVLIGSLLGHKLPLTITQMLWVNLIMDTFAAAALASLPPNERVMDHKPRKSTDFIITKKMRQQIISVGILFIIFLLGLLLYFQDKSGDISPLDLSRYFTYFVMLQFWNMLNAKAFLSGKSAFHNLSQSIGFVVVLFLILIGQILIVQYGGLIFRTIPLSLKDWLFIIGTTSVVLWIGELGRWIKRVQIT
jgi:Ca2+-transporting ATPase